MAAGGAGFIAKNMSKAPAPQVVVNAAPSAPAIKTVDVLVLASDLPMGATIENQLEWQAWPSNTVSEYFVTRDKEPEALEQLKGSVARLAMYQGEPLRKSKLIGQGQSFMSAILPSGKRAVATQIAADTSAGGFILPNDYVDVIMTRRSDTGGAQGFVTETILKNIRVLAIDQAIQENEEGRKVKVGDTATLELTPQQAEIITVAQQMADRLTLALRSVVDTQEANLDEADYLISGNGRRGTVRLIKSGVVSEEGARK
ncbi:pilus assembly protein CpaB [Mesorhizobium australicum]|uniref:Pilus assembly protein CpaB n=2 Tax=Mesorhizobium australicum TaxID=536018 RepID=A0A1X7NAQ6_9HYPH|nr:pilus assembly protein CpaB [Mesorhizobium australicum]